MSYRELEQHFRRLGHLHHVEAILGWDEAVVMPAAAGPQRAEALATLSLVTHGFYTDERLATWIMRAEREVLDPWCQANLREIKRVVARAQAVPAMLVERAARARLRCEQAWRQLRPQSDFASLAPLLADVVSVQREVAFAVGGALGLAPYDALLDEYEPGCRSCDIDVLFDRLKAFLPALIDQVVARQQDEPVFVPRGPFPISAQERLGRTLMAAVGFDFAHGRLDVSHHPFCGGVPSDVRVTTRYDVGDFTKALMGMLHETGHAKYEQGLPPAFVGQPVGAARGMSMHEGQSLLQEMQVSRSRAFLTFAAPQIRAAFPERAAEQPEAFTIDNLCRLYTRVARSKIRVDADEVTYPCHILIRYEIERDLIAGKLQVSDIPEAWDAGMRALLGISTGDDHRDGCMQDVHWPSGAFGYFPTYTLGAMTAAQLFAAALEEHPSLPEDMARGEFQALNAFLSQQVWSQASLLSSDELMRQATGEGLDPRFFEAHLRGRYLAVQ